MSNYLYNGTSLPALPSLDNSTKPYAFIATVTTGDLSGETVFVCKGSKVTVQTDGATISGLSAITGYIHSGYAWVETSIPANSTLHPIWANHDIYYYGDSTLYLAASVPVPVSTVPIDSNPACYILGRQFGKRIIAQRKPRKPVAYLYNGVQLPALPEWDRETYPYAFISNEIFDTTVFRALSQRPATNGTATSIGTIVNPYDANIPMVGCSLNADSNEWGELSTSSLGTEGQITLPFWSNFDVYYADGTIFLTASEPVPVYE